MQRLRYRRVARRLRRPAQGACYDTIVPFNKDGARQRKIWNSHTHLKSWRGSGNKRKRGDEGADVPWTLLHKHNYELYEMQHRYRVKSFSF